MRKSMNYRVQFDAATLESAIAEMNEVLRSSSGASAEGMLQPTMQVKRGDETWLHDDWHEFLADFSRENDWAMYMSMAPGGGLTFQQGRYMSTVEVQCGNRSEIERVFRVFDSAVPRMPASRNDEASPTQPRVFIGHGGDSSQWRLLKEHLRELHDYEVFAFESGSRSGHTIRDILSELMEDNDFAILVMTGADEQSDGRVRARQNVIHEAGLFQGRIGFARTAILVEEGVEMFSNLDGIQYIPFSQNNIRESFGDVLAHLRREFPPRR